jgi:hypothetical protein
LTAGVYPTDINYDSTATQVPELVGPKSMPETVIWSTVRAGDASVKANFSKHTALNSGNQ